MAPPTKTVYENSCRICSSKTVTAKLSVIVTKSGEKQTPERNYKTIADYLSHSMVRGTFVCVVGKNWIT